MKELTKGEWTTLTLKRKVAQKLKNYKEAHGFKSLGDAIQNAMDLANEYVKMSELCAQREMTKHE